MKKKYYICRIRQNKNYMSTEEADEHPVPKKPRFATLSEDVMNSILKDKDSENTKKATDRAVRLFRKYWNEKNRSEDFENYEISELEEALTKFYSEARNESGDLYKKSTLTNTRYGINRFLSEKNIDIIKDHGFVNSNKMFKAMTVQLKREGKDDIDHHPPIEADD